MCLARPRVDLAAVARGLIAIAKARIAAPDGATSGATGRFRVVYLARAGVARAAVLEVVVEVDFAAVLGVVVAIVVASNARGDGARPVAGARRRRMGQRARLAALAGAPRIRVGRRDARAVAEFLVRRAPLIELREVDHHAARRECAELCEADQPKPSRDRQNAPPAVSSTPERRGRRPRNGADRACSPALGTVGRVT